MASPQPTPDAAESVAALTMVERLLSRTHLGTADGLAAAVAEEARSIGAERVGLYVVDYAQATLVPVTAGREEPLAIEGSVAGRAFAGTTAVIVGRDGGRGLILWLPLLDGTERIGVMDMHFPALAELPESLLLVCERYAHLVSIMVVSKSAYSDYFDVLRRREPMTIASDLLWDLTPPLVLATDDFVLGAFLEPCYDMGGDAFDYALNGDVLHFGVFDAMGHGLPAAGLTAFALAAYRNARRRGLPLSDTYAAVDEAVFAQYPDSRFVTALLAELDTGSGRLRWVSAGHPPPLLLRDGRLVKTLGVSPSPPVGLQLAPAPPAEGEEALQPGDLLLLYTDGITEARRPGGELFTVERLGEFIERQAARGRPAPETLRRLRDAIIAGGSLRDDATALLVEWRRGSERALLPETV